MAKKIVQKSKLKFNATTVYYYVKDMDRAINFYTKTLGLPLKIRFENYWAEVDAGPITIGLHPTDKGKNVKQTGGGTLSMSVENIEKMRSALVKKGATISEIFKPERGKFAYITDPDGNNIHISEFDPKWKKENKY